MCDFVSLFVWKKQLSQINVTEDALAPVTMKLTKAAIKQISIWDH